MKKYLLFLSFISFVLIGYWFYFQPQVHFEKRLLNMAVVGSWGTYKEFREIDNDSTWDLLLISYGMTPEHPDEFYFLFGKYGKITFKSIARPVLHQVLEKFRTFRGSDQEFHQNYKIVNHTIFQEVPAIHLSYGRSSYLYNHKKLTFHGKKLDSIGSLSNFHWD